MASIVFLRRLCLLVKVRKTGVFRRSDSDIISMVPFPKVVHLLIGKGFQVIIWAGDTATETQKMFDFVRVFFRFVGVSVCFCSVAVRSLWCFLVELSFSLVFSPAGWSGMWNTQQKGNIGYTSLTLAAILLTSASCRTIPFPIEGTYQISMFTILITNHTLPSQLPSRLPVDFWPPQSSPFSRCSAIRVASLSSNLFAMVSWRHKRSVSVGISSLSWPEKDEVSTCLAPFLGGHPNFLSKIIRGWWLWDVKIYRMPEKTSWISHCHTWKSSTSFVAWRFEDKFCSSSWYLGLLQLDLCQVTQLKCTIEKGESSHHNYYRSTWIETFGFSMVWITQSQSSMTLDERGGSQLYGHSSSVRQFTHFGFKFGSDCITRRKNHLMGRTTT